MCKKGYYLSGNTCTTCPLNEYKETAGNSPNCTRCQTGAKTLNTTSTIATQCCEYFVIIMHATFFKKWSMFFLWKRIKKMYFIVANQPLEGLPIIWVEDLSFISLYYIYQLRIWNGLLYYPWYFLVGLSWSLLIAKTNFICTVESSTLFTALVPW